MATFYIRINIKIMFFESAIGVILRYDFVTLYDNAPNSNKEQMDRIIRKASKVASNFHY